MAPTVWSELKLSTQPDTPAVAVGADVTGFVAIATTGKRAITVITGQPLSAQLVHATGHLGGRCTVVVAGIGTPAPRTR